MKRKLPKVFKLLYLYLKTVRLTVRKGNGVWQTRYMLKPHREFLIRSFSIHLYLFFTIVQLFYSYNMKIVWFNQKCENASCSQTCDLYLSLIGTRGSAGAHVLKYVKSVSAYRCALTHKDTEMFPAERHVEHESFDNNTTYFNQHVPAPTSFSKIHFHFFSLSSAWAHILNSVTKV